MKAERRSEREGKERSLTVGEGRKEREKGETGEREWKNEREGCGRCVKGNAVMIIYNGGWAQVGSGVFHIH